MNVKTEGHYVFLTGGPEADPLRSFLRFRNDGEYQVRIDVERGGEHGMAYLTPEELSEFCRQVQIKLHGPSENDIRIAYGYPVCDQWRVRVSIGPSTGDVWHAQLLGRRSREGEVCRHGRTPEEARLRLYAACPAEEVPGRTEARMEFLHQARRDFLMAVALINACSKFFPAGRDDAHPAGEIDEYDWYQDEYDWHQTVEYSWYQNDFLRRELHRDTSP